MAMDTGSLSTNIHINNTSRHKDVSIYADEENRREKRFDTLLYIGARHVHNERRWRVFIQMIMPQQEPFPDYF